MPSRRPRSVWLLTIAAAVALGLALASRGGGSRPLAAPPPPSLGDFDGRGVTIALLDTGVDRSHPFLRGRVLAGYDVAGTGADAAPRANPRDATDVERHGTEMAGILVGAGGPSGLRGVA